MGYGATGNGRDSVKKLSRKMKKMIRENPGLLTGRSSSSDEPSKPVSGDDDSDLLAEEQAWTNRAGKTIKAAVVSAGDTNVVFLMSNGKQVVYPVAKLSTESQKRISSL